MKAVYYEAFGDAAVLQLGQRPIPEPGPDEVLIQTAAAAVNPIDRRLRAGELQAFFERQFPIIPGWDFSGKIVKTGANVKNWHPGDEVLGLAFTWFLHGGTYAEYVTVNAGSIAAKPKSISYLEAAALPLVSLTAWQSLADYGKLQPGQTVLIQAGAGGLGSVAIPIAKHLGAYVYTTTSQKNRDYVHSLGADNIIDYQSSNYVEAVFAGQPEGLDMVFESLTGTEMVENAIRLAKTGGVVHYMNNEPPPMPEIATRRIKTEFMHHRADGKCLEGLMELYINGTIPIPRIEVMPLAAAADAHRASESGRTQGKIVLEVQTRMALV